MAKEDKVGIQDERNESESESQLILLPFEYESESLTLSVLDLNDEEIHGGTGKLCSEKMSLLTGQRNDAGW